MRHSCSGRARHAPDGHPAGTLAHHTSAAWHDGRQEPIEESQLDKTQLPDESMKDRNMQRQT